MTLNTITEAARTAMNAEAGQALTEKLLEQVAKQNPNITTEEWEDIKARFLAYMTIKMAQEINRERRA